MIVVDKKRILLHSCIRCVESHISVFAIDKCECLFLRTVLHPASQTAHSIAEWKLYPSDSWDPWLMLEIGRRLWAVPAFFVVVVTMQIGKCHLGQ